MIQNPTDFYDKVVLDVGCGSAILSFFAVQAGAKKVYAIDASDIIDEAIKVVEHNKLSDKIILIKGKVEEIDLPEKVDVIVSEWMGYFLLYESMLSSVFHARDKWLKKEGKIFPTEANLYLSLFEEERFYKERTDFWKNIYGIDYSPIIPFAKKCSFNEPQIEYLSPMAELSFPQKFLTIDCMNADYETVKNFTTKFSFTAIVCANAHGIVGYFDVVFKGTNNTLTLTTSPSAIGTHWRQSLFFFDDPVPVLQDSLVEGTISVAPHVESNRSILVSLSCSVNQVKVDKVFHIR